VNYHKEKAGAAERSRLDGGFDEIARADSNARVLHSRALACVEAESLHAFVQRARSLRELAVAGSGAMTFDHSRTAGMKDRLARPIHDARIRTLVHQLLEGNAHMLRRSERDWGQTFGMSPSHLGRLVRAHTTQSFRDLRRVCRIQLACRLLTRDDEQVAQIAFAAGYEPSQMAQFCREFRYVVGVTPRTFRSLVRDVRPHSRLQQMRAARR
jgi:AraC-like DNA-binding protein